MRARPEHEGLDRLERYDKLTRAAVNVQGVLCELDRTVPPPVAALQVHRAQPNLPVAAVRLPRPRKERPGRADVAHELLEARQLEEDAAPSLLGDAVVRPKEELPRLLRVVARDLGPAGREPYLPGQVGGAEGDAPRVAPSARTKRLVEPFVGVVG